MLEKCSCCRKSFSENFDILYAYIKFQFYFCFSVYRFLFEKKQITNLHACLKLNVAHVRIIVLAGAPSFLFLYPKWARPSQRFLSRFSFLSSFEKKTAALVYARGRAELLAHAIFFKFHLRTYRFSTTLLSLGPLSLFSINKYRPIQPPKII